MCRLVKRLGEANISYAIIGNMAVRAHGGRCLMMDHLDVLFTADGFAAFQQRFVPQDYAPVPHHDNWFNDRAPSVLLRIRLTGWKPHCRFPVPVVYPDPAEDAEIKDGIRYVNLQTLIELKLAAGWSVDFADVVALTAAHNIDESWAERFHPALRPAFQSCLDETRREAEFLARNG